MLDSVVEVLNAFGLMPAIQFVAITLSAIFIFTYLVNRG